MPSGARSERDYRYWLTEERPEYYYPPEEEERRQRRIRTITFIAGAAAVGVLGYMALRRGKVGLPLAKFAVPADGTPLPPGDVEGAPSLLRLLKHSEEAMEEFVRESYTRYGGPPDAAAEAALKHLLETEGLGTHRIDEDLERSLINRFGIRHLTLGELADEGKLPETLLQDKTFQAFAAQHPREEWYSFIFDKGLFITDTDLAVSKDYMALRKATDALLGIEPPEQKVINLTPLLRRAGRSLDDFIQNYKLPVVGFNPLSMLYIDDLIASARAPDVFLAKAGTIQGFISGQTRPIATPLLYVKGKVYDILDIAEQAKAGNFDLKPIATGMFLARGDRGPIPRIARQMMGVQQKITSRMPITGDWLIMRKPIAPFREGFLRQFTAGRHDLQHVTPLTLIPYQLMSRLNEGLRRAEIGGFDIGRVLALPDEYLGSAASIFAGLMTKRVLPVVAAVYGFKYINFTLRQLIGAGFDDAAVELYKGASLGLASLNEALGITRIARRYRHLFPGGEQLSELPIINLLPKPYMTREELEEWFEEGEVPIRRGRYWMLGSTPFTGSTIEEFRPNIYRMTMAKPQYTDVLYGSEEEYWAHAPVPTPQYPLAPLRRYVTDRYWLEERHKYDRPYPVTGGFPELEELPVIGPSIGRLLSNIIKPPRAMYPEYYSGGGTIAPAAPPESGDGVGPGTGPGMGRKVGAPGGSGAVPLTYYYDPNSIRSMVARQIETLKDVSGFYGVAMDIATGRRPDLPDIVAESRAMYSPRRWFWDLSIGGLGGDVNEIGRRLIGKEEKWAEAYNPIPNTMPSWLPQEFRTGDPYVRIQGGEYRLPGPGYEALHRVPAAEIMDKVLRDLGYEPSEVYRERPDIQQLKYELYDPLTRLKILADVAPYSEEYRRTSAAVSSMKLTKEQLEEAREARRKARQRLEPMRVYPYRFKGVKTASMRVTIEEMVTNDVFTVKELPGIPIKIAGVNIPRSGNKEYQEKVRQFLDEHLYKDQTVTIYYDPEDLGPQRRTKRLKAAVVTESGVNVGRKAIKIGIGKEIEDDFSPAAVITRFNPFERLIGRAWETIAHLDTPIHTKFLQVRSPLEMYERRDVYGKTFQDWRHPIRDFLIPTAESIANKPFLEALIFSTALGAAFGATRKGMRTGALVGLALGLGLKAYGAIAGGGRGGAFVPPRRLKEYAINEYFDTLKYIKYMRLFEEEARRAKEEEGKDVRAYLIGETDEEIRIEPGTHAANAALYYQMAQSTMYGHNRGEDVGAYVSALPKKERRYYRYFVDATEEERERLRQIAPDYFLRALQEAWGEEPVPKKSLEEIFSNYYLPGPTWEGWQPDVDIEDVKVRYIQHEGMDVSDFYIYKDEVDRAKRAQNVRIPKIFIKEDPRVVREKLEALLGRSGLRDAQLDVEESEDDRTEIEVRTKQRKRLKRVVEMLNSGQVGIA